MRYPSAWAVYVEVGQGHERPDVFVGVSERFSCELYPGMGEKPAACAPHANPDDTPFDAAGGEHARECNRTDEALRPEHTKARCPDDCERESAGLGHSRWTRLSGAP